MPEMSQMEAMVTMLECLENEPRGNARLSALRGMDSPVLRSALNYALNPFITFGMKKVPEHPTVPNNSSVTWDRVTAVLDRLASRDLTGYEAKEAVSNLLFCCTAVEAKWVTRIIKQDLRLKIGAKDVNKALGEDFIPVFACALATDFAKVKPKDLKGRWILQPKFDGGRVVAYLPRGGGTVVLLSRTGKTWPNFESIRKSLQVYNEYRTGDDLYLDGEVISRLNGKIDFQAIQKVMRATDGREVGTLEYHVFDAAVAPEWNEPKEKYEDRLAKAEVHVHVTATALGFSNVFFAGWDEVTDPTHETLEAASADAVAKGFEGVMILRADLPVAMKRSKTLIKVKLFQEDEFEIVGYEEGEGDCAGMLGAAKLRTHAGVPFKAGSGFTPKERADLWAIKETLPGQWATIKFLRYTDDGSLNLPTWRAIRHPDDIGRTSDQDEADDD